MKHSFLVLGILSLTLTLHAKIGKSFYERANNRYYNYAATTSEPIEYDIQTRYIDSMKQNLNELENRELYTSFIENYTLSGTTNPSVDLSLILLTDSKSDSTLNTIDQFGLNRYITSLLKEVSGVERTLKPFYFSDKYFNPALNRKDKVEKTDDGFIYHTKDSPTYKINLDKEYLIRSWSKPVETKRGIIPVFVSFTYEPYLDKMLISGFHVDVAKGGLVTDVAITYNRTGEIPLFKTMDITTTQRRETKEFHLTFIKK